MLLFILCIFAGSEHRDVTLSINILVYNLCDLKGSYIAFNYMRHNIMLIFSHNMYLNESSLSRENVTMPVI